MKFPCYQIVEVFSIRGKGEGESIDERIDSVHTSLHTTLTLANYKREIEIEIVSCVVV